MRKLFIFILAQFVFLLNVIAQNESKIADRLKVFIDCNNTWCDMTFIRTEINIVDFMLDRIASDVHVLITSQGTGSGGDKYQLIFFGQNRFKNLQDTLYFNTGPNQTDFEIRDMLIKYLKLGLAPFVAKTEAAKDVIINFKKTETESGKKDTTSKTKKDPWNYWVFRLGTNGGINGDANYKDLRYSGYFSANRVTEELKISFSFNGNKNKSIFKYEDPNGIDPPLKIINENHGYNFSHYLIKSINGHWSWGYEANYNQSSFSNYKSQVLIRSGFEYDIFPYKDVNNKLFTINYTIGVRFNRYYDSTIYDKMHETLFSHGSEANMTFNQKWGSTSIGINYQNYLNNWKYFNLGINAFLNVRITGGLSFNIGIYGALTRDQVFLSKKELSEQDVLIRRRQIASGYNYFTSFGISYRFGSKLNNFVNPRFEGGNNIQFFY